MAIVKNGTILKTVFQKGNYNNALRVSSLAKAISIYEQMPNKDNTLTSNVGLVVGKIQSGKTANIITLSALALDNDYRVIVLLLSDTNNLLTQNTKRFIESFDGAPGIEVVKKSTDGDFNTKLNSDTLDYLHYSGKSLVICSLKHHKHIEEINQILSNSPFKDEYAMIIDDEGDDIGLNTAKFDEKFVTDGLGNLEEDERTSTNKAIVKLKNSMGKLAYISLTATPEANILLQNFQELAPDYCVTLEPGQGYTGLISFHGEDSDKVIEIDDYVDMNDTLSGLPKSFDDAFVFFIAGCIIRNVRENAKNQKTEFKHSMMVHPSHTIDDHRTAFTKVENYVKKIRHDLTSSNQSGKIFYDKVCDQIKIIDASIVADHKMVENAVKYLKLHIVNSQSSSNDLKSAMAIMPNHIVVGGNMLDRGITIEGLAVSYMIRMAKVGQVDTLLQRARWFGYKESYFDLCRVYMPSILKNQFTSLIETEESVWSFLKFCEKQKSSLKDCVGYFVTDEGMRLVSSAKAAVKSDRLLTIARNQAYIVHDHNKNQDNIDLVNTTFTWSARHDKQYGPQTHRVQTIQAADFLKFIDCFHFSEEDSAISVDKIKALLQIAGTADVDIWDIRYKTKERRSTDEYRVKALLQGYSEGKLPGDPSYYVGDRNLQTSNLSVQIHHVILKNDIDNQYHKGDEVIMLAIILPDSYSPGVYTSRMSHDDIINALL